jgi:hypothetical protein
VGIGKVNEDSRDKIGCKLVWLSSSHASIIIMDGFISMTAAEGFYLEN